MDNKTLWDIEDIIKELALKGCDSIGLFETAEYLSLTQDEVLECFIDLSRRKHSKLNIKYLVKCPICKENLISYGFDNGLEKIKEQYYCHRCEDYIDTDFEHVFLIFKINPNYLEAAKEYKKQKRLEKAKELAKYINSKTKQAGLTYEEIQEEVFKAWKDLNK